MKEIKNWVQATLKRIYIVRTDFLKPEPPKYVFLAKRTNLTFLVKFTCRPRYFSLFGLSKPTSLDLNYWARAIINHSVIVDELAYWGPRFWFSPDEKYFRLRLFLSAASRNKLYRFILSMFSLLPTWNICAVSL